MNSLVEEIKLLNKAMTFDYLSVNKDRNPIAKNMDSLSVSALENVICQYSFFPKNIISFFITALYNLNYHGWSDISDELIQNLNEELGKPLDGDDSQGHEKFLYRPHYVILRQGIFTGLGLDIKLSRQSEPTLLFLSSIRLILDSDSPAVVAGATFALECSAVPELQIVSSLVERLFALRGVIMTKELKEFFVFHIDEIEIGHRDRLVETFKKYFLLDEDVEKFEKGFREVLVVMDAWWSALGSSI